MKGKVLFYTLLCIACTGTYVSASNVTWQKLYLL